MRILLLFATTIALVFSGCANEDVNSGSPANPLDASAKPGSGPGAPPSSGPGTPAAHFFE